MDLKGTNVSAAVIAVALMVLLIPVSGEVRTGYSMCPAIDGLPSINLSSVTGDRACFTENLGQWPIEVGLIAEVGFGHIGLSRTGFVFDVSGPGTGAGNIVRYDLVGARGTGPKGVDPLPYQSSFFYGNDGTRWVSGARNYRGAVYESAWDGIDVNFRLGAEGAKYEFRLMPYADPNDIAIMVSGHSAIRTDGADLFLTLENGPTLQESGLRAFYMDGPESSIDVSFDVIGDLVMFKIGDYDRSRPLVIDPLLLNSTFVGSYGADDHGEIVKDENGDIYIVGRCAASGFPTTLGAYNSSWAGYYDMVVLKMDRYLTELLYSTYVGGVDGDFPTDMVYAGNGEVIITGQTYSADFPTTEGAYQRELNSTIRRTADLFVLHLNSTGSGLLGSTYLGWASSEGIAFIELDGSGAPIVLSSVGGQSVPTNSSSHDATFNGKVDIAVLRMSMDLGSLTYTSYLGGSGEDQLVDTEEGSDDRIYFTGTTSSKDFPVAKDAYGTVFNTTCTNVGFFGRFDPGTGDIEKCSYVNFLLPKALELDSRGNMVIGGNTNRTSLRTTEGSYQRSLGGRMDLAVLSFLPNGTALIASTYLGGWENESMFDIALNGTDCVFISGTGGPNFPVTPGAYSTKPSGMYDCFVSVMTGNLSDLIYSTLIGGWSYDYPYSIIPDSNEMVFLAGTTMSSNYPVTVGCYSGSFSGVTDLFVSRMACPKIYLGPTMPRDLTGEIFDDRVVLNWSEPSWDGDAGISGYNVSRSLGASPPVVIATTSDLSYIDTTIDIKETYSYFVTAFNRIGDSPPSKTITLWEKVPPTIEKDLTPEVVAPGEDIVFMVKVTDNSMVDRVELMYWSEGAEVIQDKMSRKGGDTFLHITTTEDREYCTYYVIVAFDIKGNHVTTGQKRTNISGEYLPVFEEDLTPATVASLSPLRFGVKVRDNWVQPIVHLEYCTGDGSTRNVTMGPVGEDAFFFDTKATGQPGEVMTYIFRAEDVNGNWNSSNPGTVLIVDSDAPYLLSDLSSKVATTGDPFVLRALVDDDDDIDRVEAIYSYGEGPEEVLPLTCGNSPLWTGTISVPHMLSNLYYMFRMLDAFGNERTTERASIGTIDNDLPSVISDTSDGVAYDSAPFTFSISVDDNIEVGRVIVIHAMNGGPGQELILEGAGPKVGTFLVPTDAVGRFEYSVRVVDTSGNENSTGTVQVNIIDRTGPRIEAVDDVSTYVGQEVRIELEVSDNIDVTSIFWEGLPMPFVGMVWTGTYSEPGTYHITVEAKDAAGNSASAGFDVQVLSLTNDLDDDGLPDLFEVEHGLDPLDPSDASGDLDDDGLTNLEEYDIGTDVDISDTDGDGMDDRWEVLMGLDPIDFSAMEDPDGDERPNIQEYLEGSDPMEAEHPVEREGEDGQDIMYLVLAALVVTSLVLVYFVVRGRGGRKHHLR